MTENQIPDAATDPRVDPAIRAFLAEPNKGASPFWLLPGEQVRVTLAGLQASAARDLSGVTVEQKDVVVVSVTLGLPGTRRPGAGKRTARERA